MLILILNYNKINKMTAKNVLKIKSLKEQVYDYLRGQINKKKLKPGSAINMDTFSKKLGISKTPLRDALIQLEMEGFVTILPRKGIYVNPLTRQDIRNYYQVIGALESSAMIQSVAAFRTEDISRMEKLNQEMRDALDRENYDLFFRKNLDFHNTFIQLSQNETLGTILHNLKKRLYDFPRQEKWIKEWELSSVEEHQKIISLIKRKKVVEAAEFIRDVHWSFTVQEKFINKYYFDQT